MVQTSAMADDDKSFAWIEFAELWPRDYFGESGLFETLYNYDKTASMRLRRRSSFKSKSGKLLKINLSQKPGDRARSQNAHDALQSSSLGAHGRHVASMLAKGYVEVVSIKLESVAQILGSSNARRKLKTLRLVSKSRLDFLNDHHLVKQSLKDSRAWSEYKERIVPQEISFNYKHRAALESKGMPSPVDHDRYYPTSPIAFAAMSANDTKSKKHGLPCCSSRLRESCVAEIARVDADNDEKVDIGPFQEDGKVELMDTIVTPESMRTPTSLVLSPSSAGSSSSTKRLKWKFPGRKVRPSNSKSVTESLNSLAKKRGYPRRVDMLPRNTKEDLGLKKRQMSRLSPKLSRLRAQSSVRSIGMAIE